MKVKNHKEFALFDYNSTDEPTKITFGDIVTKKSEDGIEIGVVIQVHNRFEFRVDMFGNSSIDEVSLSTIEEVKAHRPELIYQGKIA